jgi:hypothetical protein
MHLRIYIYALAVLTTQHILYCSQQQTFSYLTAKVPKQQPHQQLHKKPEATAASQHFPIVMPPLPPLPAPIIFSGLPLLPAAPPANARTVATAAQLKPPPPPKQRQAQQNSNTNAHGQIVMPPLPPLMPLPTQQIQHGTATATNATAAQLMPPPPPQPQNPQLLAARVLHNLERERKAVLESSQTQDLFKAVKIEEERIRQHEQHMQTFFRQPSNLEYVGHWPMPAGVISHLMHIHFEFDSTIRASDTLQYFQQAAAINAYLKKQGHVAPHSASQMMAHMIPRKFHKTQSSPAAAAATFHNTAANQQQPMAHYSAKSIAPASKEDLEERQLIRLSAAQIAFARANNIPLYYIGQK